MLAMELTYHPSGVYLWEAVIHSRMEKVPLVAPCKSVAASDERKRIGERDGKRDGENDGERDGHSNAKESVRATETNRQPCCTFLRKLM